MAAITFTPITGAQPCSRAGTAGCDLFQERQVSSSAKCDLRSSIFPFYTFIDSTKKPESRAAFSLVSVRQRTQGRSRSLKAVAAKETSAATVVAREVDFVWKGDAKEVFLTGSFLNWEKKVALKKLSEGVFSTKQKLEPGSHTYKFIVDGVWIHSPEEPTIDDGTGGLNNEVVVTEEVATPPKAAPEPPRPSPKPVEPAKASPAVAASETAAPAAEAATPAAPKPAEASKAAAAAPAAAPVPKKKAAAKNIKEAMEEDVIPAITKALNGEDSITDVALVFEDNQLRGTFTKNGIPYCFWAYFPDGTFEGSRGFSLTSHGNPPSTVEPFLIDEKRITPDLVVFWVTKRLFAQKLLSLN